MKVHNFLDVPGLNRDTIPEQIDLDQDRPHTKDDFMYQLTKK